MTLWQTPTVSVFSHDFMTNHGVLEGVTIHTSDEGYDVIGSGMIRVPVNAANVAQIERNRIIVAVTQSSLTAGDLIYPAFFIIKNMQYVVADGKTQIEVTGPGLLEELNRRSIGKNIIAGLVEATLASTVEPVEVATTLASTASGGATSVVVSDATSFAVGQTIEIELDVGGSRHNSRITSVVSTTIGIENSLPSDATAGNAVSTHTGFILSVTVTAGAFEPGHPAHITLDDGTIHAGTIAEYTPGSPGTLRILEGLPSIATSGNDVFQYTSVGVDAVTELMTGYAPADWTVSITAASTEAMLFGGNESVFEALLQIGKQVRGHFRYVPDPQGTRVLEWLDTPDTMEITNFRMPLPAELPTLDANDAIIESIRQDKSEQAAQVTRIYPQGAMGLDISRAENFVTPNANFTVDWAGGFIVNTAAESGGAPRVDKFVPFEHIQATGSTEGELTQASIVLYQAAEQWLEDREEDDPIFYECTVQVHKPLKPYATVHVAYVADSPGLVINDTLIIQGFTYEMGLDNILRAHVRLSNIEAFRQEGDSNFLATHVQRVDNALRHMGSFSSAQSSILASVPVTRNIFAGIGLGGGGTLLHDVTIYLNPPATVSLSSTNLQGPNHTHEFDPTGLDTHDPVTIGAGGLSAKLSITAGQVLTLANIDYSELTGLPDLSSLHARQHVITDPLDHTVTGAAFDLIGLSAANTLAVVTPSSNPGASELHLKTGSGGGLQLLRLGIGIAPLNDNSVRVVNNTWMGISSVAGRLVWQDLATDLLEVRNGVFQAPMVGGGVMPLFPLHAVSSINASALQVEAPSLTNSVAVSIQNLPLSTGVGDGKGFEIKAGGDDYARLMMYSNGMIGMGPGTATRDVLLDRPAANTFRISSDGGSGGASLQFNNGAYVGLGPSAGRITFTDATPDVVRIVNANLVMNDGATDSLWIRKSGNVSTVEADILAEASLGLAGQQHVGIFIDAINATADSFFSVFKDGESFASATKILDLTEGSLLTIGEGSSQAQIRLNGGAGNVRDVIFSSGGTARWLFRCGTTAESGSNTGSDFVIQSRADDGSLIANALQIQRSDGAVQVGSPTGGYKGVGTLNAKAVYDDNTLLTDHILDLYYDGRMRPEDEARYPNARLWTIQETADFTRAFRHLPTMPGRDEWAKGSRSLGAMVTALWETVEQQQLQIFDLQEQIQNV